MSDFFKDVAAGAFFVFLVGFAGVVVFSVWTLVEQYGALKTSALVMITGLVVFLGAFAVDTRILNNE